MSTQEPNYLTKLEKVLTEFGNTGGLYFDVTDLLRTFIGDEKNKSTLERVIKRSLENRSGKEEEKARYKAYAQDSRFLRYALEISDDASRPRSMLEEWAYEAATNYQDKVIRGTNLDQAGQQAVAPIITMMTDIKNGRFFPTQKINVDIDSFIGRYEPYAQRTVVKDEGTALPAKSS